MLGLSRAPPRVKPNTHHDHLVLLAVGWFDHHYPDSLPSHPDNHPPAGCHCQDCLEDPVGLAAQCCSGSVWNVSWVPNAQIEARKDLEGQGPKLI